jgi:multiple sugar transport system substrate-binding protein
MMIRRSGGAAMAVLSLILAACNSGATPTPSTSTGTGPSAAASAPASGGESPSAGASGGSSLQASGKLFAFGVSYKTSDEIAQGRIDLFKKNFPDVDVTFSESGFDSQGFLAALQGSTPPDVVRIPRDRLGTYAARGVLEPLTDCVTKAGVDMSNFREAAVKQVTVDGTV